MSDEETLEDAVTEEISEEELEEILMSLDPGAPGWSPTTLVYYGATNRSILISGEIDQDLSDGICSQIHELSKQSQTEPITIYINTPGGSVNDALAIYDLLRCCACPVITIVTGMCYSAGLIILCAGDFRLSTPHSTFFYHQPIMFTSEVSSTEALQFAVQTYEWSQQHLDQIIRTRAGIPKSKWQKDFQDRTAKHFGVKKAQKYNLIHKVLEYFDKSDYKFELEE